FERGGGRDVDGKEVVFDLGDVGADGLSPEQRADLVLDVELDEQRALATARTAVRECRGQRGLSYPALTREENESSIVQICEIQRRAVVWWELLPRPGSVAGSSRRECIHCRLRAQGIRGAVLPSPLGAKRREGEVGATAPGGAVDRWGEKSPSPLGAKRREG